MYRLNVIPCHKPWRGMSFLMTENLEVFTRFREFEGGSIDELELPYDYEDIYSYLDDHFINVTYPVTILDEITVWTD